MSSSDHVTDTPSQNHQNSPGDSQLLSRMTRLTSINIFSNLMVPLAGLIDIAFLGHLEDIRHLTGVALATILFDYLYRSCKFLRMSTTGTTAQAVGRSDEGGVYLTLFRHGLIAFSLAIIILLFQKYLGDWGFALLSAAPEIKETGLDYYQACIWGAPAVLLNFVCMGWFLGQSQSQQVLYMAGLSNGVNILLDYWLIVHQGMDSVGAAIATVISQYMMLMMAIVWILLEIPWSQVRVYLQDLWDTPAFKNTFAMNLDIWIRTLASVTLFAVFINISSSLGTLTLASNSLMVEVISLAVFLVEGSAFAIETLAGSLSAAGQHDQLWPLLRSSGTAGLGLGLTFALVFMIFPETMFGLLTNHADVRVMLNGSVIWLLPVIGILSIAYVLEGYFLGLTQMATIRNSMLWAILVGFSPLAVMAWHSQQPSLLWLGLVLFMLVRVVVMVVAVPPSLSPAPSELA